MCCGVRVSHLCVLYKQNNLAECSLFVTVGRVRFFLLMFMVMLCVLTTDDKMDCIPFYQITILDKGKEFHKKVISRCSILIMFNY